MPEGALFLWENAGEERNGRNGVERRNSGRRAEEKWRDGGQRRNGEMAGRVEMVRWRKGHFLVRNIQDDKGKCR